MAGVKGKSGGARPNSGGARPGSGPKPRKPVKKRGAAYKTEDPDDFLRKVMADPNVDFKDRMAAALALKKTGKGSAPLGKKEQQQAAAEEVVERNLAPAGAPTKPRLKLVA